jgi:hypothetical protein
MRHYPRSLDRSCWLCRPFRCSFILINTVVCRAPLGKSGRGRWRRMTS